MIDGLLVQLIEYLRGRGLIDLAPINIGITLTPNIPHDPLVLRTASRELSSVDGKRVPILGISHLSLVVLDLVHEELLKRLVLVDGLRASDSQARYTRLVARICARVNRRRVVIAVNVIFLDRKGGFEGNLRTILVESQWIECLISGERTDW